MIDQCLHGVVVLDVFCVFVFELSTRYRHTKKPLNCNNLLIFLLPLQLFYQVKGDMCLKVIENGKHKDVHIKEGQV